MSEELKKAMILAAGFGTRLLPHTENKPKALVEYQGKPLLKILIEKLILTGVEEIVINIHHFAEQIESFIDANHFDVRIDLIHEKELLGTGGGIKNARKFLESSKHFLVHNADIISEIDLNKMFRFHYGHDSIATLAVKKRQSSRQLLFDEQNLLSGRIINDEKTILRNGMIKELAFCGVQILSNRIFEYMPKENVFDIIPVYLEAAKNENILAFDIADIEWKDMGKAEYFSD